MWSLHTKLIPPKHKFGIYSIEAKNHDKEKVAPLKPARAVRPLPVDNVSRIANKVDSMSIDNQPKDENKNTEVLSTKETSNAENIAVGPNAMTQGDKLNQIKASRLTHSRPNTQRADRIALFSGHPGHLNQNVNNTKRTVTTGKINVTHQRRPITRSKSSQGSSKNVVNENSRSNVGSASSINMSVPVPLSMTLRSNNRIYSLRQ